MPMSRDADVLELQGSQTRHALIVGQKDRNVNVAGIDGKTKRNAHAHYVDNMRQLFWQDLA